MSNIVPYKIKYLIKNNLMKSVKNYYTQTLNGLKSIVVEKDIKLRMAFRSSIKFILLKKLPKIKIHFYHTIRINQLK